MSELHFLSQERFSATAEARTALEAVRVRLGGQVMFVQSGGCCAGSTPMCYPSGDFLTGPNDVLLGEVDGAEFYIDVALDTAWSHPEFVLDVADGGPEGFSLGAGAGRHFVSRTSACLREEGPETGTASA
jgi:uncharacterized protein (DUF779 family)